MPRRTERFALPLLKALVGLPLLLHFVEKEEKSDRQKKDEKSKRGASREGQVRVTKQRGKVTASIRASSRMQLLGTRVSKQPASVILLQETNVY